MHRRCYVHCVGLSFLKYDFNTLTSAQNSYILTVNLNMSYTLITIKLSVMLRTKKNMGKTETLIGLSHLFTQIRHYCEVRQRKDASSKSKFSFSQHSCVCAGAVFCQHLVLT